MSKPQPDPGALRRTARVRQGGQRATATQVSLVPPRALLVDYGGVISRPQPAEAVAEMAAIAGLEVPLFIERYWQHRVPYDLGQDSREYWSAVLGAEPARDGSLERLIRLDVASWCSLNAGTLEVLNAAHRDGIALSLLSNAPHELADALDDHRALALFDHLLFSARLGAVKPDAAAFEGALEAISCDPGQVLFIDDRPANVEGAIACGLQAIVFVSAEQLRAALLER
jgi:putative hydrolase of the HAD superfamily